MNTLKNGLHKVLFSKGNLYLDDIQIAGEGFSPEKEVTFEFNINKPEEKEVLPIKQKDPSVLEVNVCDEIAGQDVGPGQR